MLLESAIILLLAFILDAILGETRRFHPLVGFGNCAQLIEARLNPASESYQARIIRLAGTIAVLLLVAPLIIAVVFIRPMFEYPQLIDITLLYLAIGRKSLLQHARAVIKPLQNNQLDKARKKIALIVSRDSQHMQKDDIIKATLESVIENSNDAIFGLIFWYIIGGAPAAVLYRLVNTLDAMWGYKNSRFIHFGWAAARLDDVLNWLPARITVLSFALYAKSLKLIPLSFSQGAQCASPNAGPVMSAGACALRVKLGGEAFYQGKKISKPLLGHNREATIDDINSSMKLVNHSVIIWLGVISLIALIIEALYA